MMSEVSSMNMCADANVKAPPRLEHLQQEALHCLDSFPSKVMELNNMIDSFTPSSGMIRKVQRAATTFASLHQDNTTLADTQSVSTSSTYSLISLFENSKKRMVKKKLYCNSKRYHCRKKPGPLGTMIYFIASSIAKCTKSILINPSWYILDKFFSFFRPRRTVTDAACGSPVEWHSATSMSAVHLDEDNSAISNFINVMRSSVVQLIDDTKILKKWLQALSVSLLPELPPCLVNANRTTEAIDCWAYELFFKLKNCQVNIRNNAIKAAEIGLKMNEEMEFLKLWHRVVDLRNNYIVLYKTLRHDKKFQELLQNKSMSSL